MNEGGGSAGLRGGGYVARSWWDIYLKRLNKNLYNLKKLGLFVRITVYRDGTLASAQSRTPPLGRGRLGQVLEVRLG